MAVSDVRVVMVETTHPGNIGAAARAMKTMGLEQLHLVAPREFPSAEASARASGADDVLESAVVCDSLATALTDCQRVIGASARIRSIQWPLLDPRACGTLVQERAARGERVALVFGRERSGLSNDELDLCHELVHIPANPDYASLNVAQAVQILCYEVRMARDAGPLLPPSEPEYPPASGEEMEGFYTHLEETLYRLAFITPERPGNMMRRLRRLYQRAGLDRNEVNILRGMLAAVRQALDENPR